MKGFCETVMSIWVHEKNSKFFEQLRSNKQLKECSVAWNYISWKVKLFDVCVSDMSYCKMHDFFPPIV
jgi:hypothetical protein